MNDTPVYVAKRGLDLVGAVAGLLVCTPLLLMAGGSLALLSGERPIFVQRRVGQHERIFRLYKLRTLAFKKTGCRGQWARRWGRWLRQHSVDELPQLWNVLRGDMSLVGPRPLLVEYLAYYSTEQKKRHRVRPGITGWAQIHGRNALGWPERFAHDVWYVEHVSFRLDIRILKVTLRQVVRPRYVRPEGLSEAEKFRG